MIAIRPAVVADAATIAGIQVTGWRETYAQLLSPGFLAALRPRTEMFRAGIERGAHVVVAELDGELVGYAFAGPAAEADAPRDWALWHLYQYARVHGSGTGQALLDAAVGDRPAVLWVAEDNPRAQAFYRRNGFEPDGARMVAAEWEDLAEIRMVR